MTTLGDANRCYQVSVLPRKNEILGVIGCVSTDSQSENCFKTRVFVSSEQVKLLDPCQLLHGFQIASPYPVALTSASLFP